MSNAITIQEARNEHRRSYNAVEQVLCDAEFMSGVLASLEAERAGNQGKTLEEIRREHGLTD